MVRNTPVNPWMNLDGGPADEWVLPGEKHAIDQLNRALGPGSRKRIEYRSFLPEPWIGDPRTARVLMLLLNPGLDPTGDLAVHAPGSPYRSTLVARLRHQTDGFDFVSAEMQGTPGQRWWLVGKPNRRGTLRSLVEDAGLDAVRRGFAAVEWFPYKSTTFAPLSVVLPSQFYGFELVRSAVGRGATIIVARARTKWFKAVPELRVGPKVLLTSSPRNVCITPRNLALLNGGGTSGTETARRLYEQLVESLIR